MYPGMMQMPGYQPAMMPAPMPMMPAVGTVPTMPGKAGQGHQGPFPGEQQPALRLKHERTFQGFRGHKGPRALGLATALTCHDPPAAMMVPPQPQPQPLLPSLDTRQLAIQQQNFINQQALILVRVAGPAGLPVQG